MNSIRSRNAGFSLTEVLIAAGILVVGFMLLLTLFPLGIQLTARHTEKTISGIAASEAAAAVSFLMQAKPEKTNLIVGNAYHRFDEDFYGDYDHGIFLYPSAKIDDDPVIDDEEKKYNTSAMLGYRDVSGNFAEAFIFVSRRLGSQARYPIVISSDLSNSDNVSSRPQVLTLSTASNADEYDDVPNTWVKINESHNDVLDDVGLESFIAPGSQILIHRRIPNTDNKILQVVSIISPYEDGNHYIEVEGKGSWRSRPSRANFGDISFVPPAIGANKSAAIDVSRRYIRVRR